MLVKPVAAGVILYVPAAVGMPMVPRASLRYAPAATALVDVVSAAMPATEGEVIA